MTGRTATGRASRQGRRSIRLRGYDYSQAGVYFCDHLYPEPTTPFWGYHRRGTACRAPTAEQFGQPVTGSIPTIVRSFKSAATKRINEWCRTPGAKIWQRNYYEHVVHNEPELTRIREYISNNPAQWELDTLYGRGMLCPIRPSPHETREPSPEYAVEDWMV